MSHLSLHEHSIGKSYYKHLLQRMQPQESLSCEYAYIKGRRRESAIKQQLVINWRLTSSNLSHDTISHDMRNAFASITFEVMNNILQFLIDSFDWSIFRQRYESASTKVPKGPGETECSHFEIGSGALPGDQIAADLFRIIFHCVVSKWVKDKGEITQKHFFSSALSLATRPM